MYYSNSQLLFSPSDLVQYVESPFASWMEHLALVAPEFEKQADALDPLMDVLQAQGGEHEARYLAQCLEQGLEVIDLSQVDNKANATIDAMKAGTEVIYQAYLTNGVFAGYVDFLYKVAGESTLGDYHYEVWDTKLSKELKPAFTLQMCCYQDILASIQGIRSEEFVIVLGDGELARLKTNDYYYYYQQVRDRFLAFHQQFDADNRPDPAASSSWGRWGGYAKKLIEEADHLLQVATIRRSQIKRLQKAGIKTMSELAQTTLNHVPNVNFATLQRLKRQAQLQIESKDLAIPKFDVLPIEADKKQGLAMLPPHSDSDVFFDIEGFPLVEGGLEYLWGCTYFDEKGNRQFKDFWAHNEVEEKVAFSAFIQWVYQRWLDDPSMHIYHYASYEITACRKLMGRYGICEEEVDQLLRNNVFVDLYTVVRQGMLIGEPRYSIKNVEHLYREARNTEVADGMESVVAYEAWRQQPDGSSWEESEILRNLRDYNIDDCNSTQELTEWLRAQQKQHDITYQGTDEIKEVNLEEVSTRLELRDHLLSQADLLEETNAEKAQFLRNCAWFLEFHRREDKPVFWMLFERLSMTPEELFDDNECLAFLKRTETEPIRRTPRVKNLVYEYQFDVKQDFKGSPARGYYLAGELDESGYNKKVDFAADYSDLSQGLIALQVNKEPPATIHLVPDSYIPPRHIPEALEAVIRTLNANEVVNEPSAIMDFLKRDIPRIHGHNPGDPIIAAEDADSRLEQIIQAVTQLDNSYLAIQGPPGAGKTYTAKHVITELMRQGKRVGISSNSHKAINNLLIGTAEYCQDQGISAQFACSRNTDPTIIDELGIKVIANNKIQGHLAPAFVVGTTAWGFAREDLEDQFDYLFIDEAGQVAVANLIAMSRSAKNLVLMGDQMQLGQPTQGSHPGESGLSILDYLMHDSATISADKGVFLDTTYRMHTKVNQFISDAIYEGKLQSHPINNEQIIPILNQHESPFNLEAGIVYLEVEHEGNTQASVEEVDAIKAAAHELLKRTFIAKDDTERPISWDDMLFVAPYNQQVGLLQAELGEQAKVGSVDKFQGQEAPIVFFSLCASNAEESPRGMDFLFDKNRLNVAISRAQSLAIVVANPALSSSAANNLKQQKLLNLFCHLVHYTKE